MSPDRAHFPNPRCSAALVRHSASGKSELLRQYCATQGARYSDGVWWVAAHSPLHLTETFVAMAKVLELPDRVWMHQEDGEERATGRLGAEVFRALDALGSSWLLCLDGVDDETTVRRLCSCFLHKDRAVKGHVVATSRLDRLRHWAPAGITDPIDVHGLMPHDSCLVLLSLVTGEVGAARTTLDALFHKLPTKEQDALLAITQTSGTSGFEGLPLSIELAGFALARKVTSGCASESGLYSDYQLRLEDETTVVYSTTHTPLAETENVEMPSDLDPFSTTNDEPCESEADQNGGAPKTNGTTAAQDHSSPVVTPDGSVSEDKRPKRTEDARRQASLIAMWKLGSTDFDALPKALALLQAFACFEPSQVPEQLVRGLCASEADYCAAIELLVEGRGILKRSVLRGFTSYSIHPMVMRLLRRKLRGQTYAAALDAAFRAIRGECNSWDCESFTKLDTNAVLARLSVLPHLRSVGRLAVATAAFGTSEETTQLLYAEACAEIHFGVFSRAAVLNERVTTTTSNDNLRRSSMYWLLWSVHRLGQDSEVLKHGQGILDADVSGTDALFRRAEALLWMSRVHLSLGNRSAAIEFLGQALKITETTEGDNCETHVVTGFLLHEQCFLDGESSKDPEVYDTALAAWIDVLESHKEDASQMHCDAYLRTASAAVERLLDHAEYASACSLAESTVEHLETATKFAGKGFALVRAMVLHAQCLRLVGTLEQALQVAQRAMSTCASLACGPIRHIEHLECSLALGIGQHVCGKVHDALASYREALACVSTLPSGPGVTEIHCRLLAWCGKLLLSHGDTDAGMDVLRKALEMHRETFDSGGGMTYDAMGNVRFRAFLLTHLGRAHLLARRSAEADRCLHTAFEMIQTHMRPTVVARHLDCCAIHLRVAEVAMHLGDVDRTAAALDAAEDVLAKHDTGESESDSYSFRVHPIRVKLLELRGRLEAMSTSSGAPAAAQKHFDSATDMAHQVFASSEKEHFAITRLKAAATQARYRKERQNASAEQHRRIGGSTLQSTGRAPTHFCGRRSELDALENALLEPVDGFHAVALIGASGLGKTSLVHAFAEKHRHDFSGGVYWVPCANDHELRWALFDLCCQVGLVDFSFAQASIPALFSVVVNALQLCSTKYLICFDDVDTPRAASMVQSCLGETVTRFRGTVLVISSLVSIERKVAPQGVDVTKIALLPLRKYDRALLLFRASRGLFKEYEGKVRSQMDLLDSTETRALHTLCDYDLPNTEARPPPAILLTGAYIYDVGMKAGTCVDHLAHLAAFERKEATPAAASSPEHSGSDDTPHVGTAALVTAIRMAVGELTADAQLILYMIVSLELCLIPMATLVTMIEATRAVGLSIRFEYTEKEPSETASWITEELCDRFQLLTRLAECRLRNSCGREPVLSMDACVSKLIDDMCPQPMIAAVSTCLPAFLDAALTGLPNDRVALTAFVADDARLHLVLRAALSFVIRVLDRSGDSIGSIQQFTNVALACARLSQVIGYTATVYRLCEWAETLKLSAPLEHVQFSAIRNATERGAALAAQGAVWLVIPALVRPTRVKPRLSNPNVAEVIDDEPVLSNLELALRSLRTEAAETSIGRWAHFRDDNQDAAALFSSGGNDADILLDGVAATMLEHGHAHAAALVLQHVVNQRAERTQLAPNTLSKACAQSLLGAALAKCGTVHAALAAFCEALGILEDYDACNAALDPNLVIVHAFTLWQRSVLHQREERYALACEDATAARSLLSSIEPERTPSADRLGDDDVTFADASVSALEWYCRVVQVEVDCVQARHCTAAASVEAALKELPEDVTLSTPTYCVPSAAIVPLFAVHMMQGAIAMARDNIEAAETSFVAAYDLANSAVGKAAVLAAERERAFILYADAASYFGDVNEAFTLLEEVEELLQERGQSEAAALAGFLRDCDVPAPADGFAAVLEETACAAELARVFATRGDMYSRIGDSAESQRWLSKAIEVLRTARGTAGSLELARLREKMARETAWIEEEGPEAALPLAKTVLAARRRLSRSYGIALQAAPLVWFVGTLLADCGEHAQAVTHYLEAAEDLSTGADGAELRRDLAASYDALEQPANAIAAAASALEIHRRDARVLDDQGVRRVGGGRGGDEPKEAAITELGLVHVLAMLQHTAGDDAAACDTLVAATTDPWFAETFPPEVGGAGAGGDSDDEVDQGVRQCPALLHSLCELAVECDCPEAARFFAESALALLKTTAEPDDIAFATFTLAQVLERDEKTTTDTAALYAEALAQMRTYPEEHPGRRLLELHAANNRA